MLCVRRHISALRAAAVALVGVWGAAGCTTGRYTPSTMPSAFQAPVLQNVQSVDLSKLAMSSPPSDVIDVGDVIDVTVAPSLNAGDTVTVPVRISERGTAAIPVIGELNLAGMDVVNAEAVIAGAAIERGLYRSPQVTVTMKQRRMNRVTVVGAVKLPGVYQLPRRSSDLLAAITAGGGLAPEAGTNVEIRNPDGEGSPASRPPLIAEKNGGSIEAAGHSTVADATPVAQHGPQTVTVNLVSATTRAGSGYYVSDGAVVNVERRTPTPVHVIGLVTRPGQYDFPLSRELRLLDAIALAGGTSTPVADKVFIIRKAPQRAQPVLVQISLSKAKKDGGWNMRLGEGDVVSVEETPSTVFMHALQLLRPGVGMSLGGLF